MERKNTLLLTVIAVATLLVAVVGATFAYFASTYSQDGNDQTVNVTTKTVTNVVYSTGNSVILNDNLDLPVDTKNSYVEAGELLFNVRASGSSDTDTVSYNIVLNVGNNTIKDATKQGATGNVMCKLYRNTTGTFADSDTPLYNNVNCDSTVTLNGGTKESFVVTGDRATSGYYYKLEVYVWNDDAVDNTMQGKTYYATLDIDALETVNNNGAQAVQP